MSKTSLAQRGPTMMLAGALAFLTALAACSDEGPVAPDDGVEITDEIQTDIHTDDGNVGVVLDTREIFRKGYVATTAQIDFQDHPEFSATLDVDPITNLAILSIDVDSLTDEQEAAFTSSGVAAHVAVYDADQVELASLDRDTLVLDDLNEPLSISTNLAYLTRPVVLKEGIPYLLQIEGRDRPLTTCSSHCVTDTLAYAIEDETLRPKQQFYFTAIGSEADTYFVRHFAWDTAGATWRVVEGDLLAFDDRTFGDNQMWPRADLVLEQNEDGWLKIRLKGTQQYLFYLPSPRRGEIRLTTNEDSADRFRVISDNVDWRMKDRGTVFNQPIMPPANLTFAYKATLKNCSPATLEEEIGEEKEETRETAVGTSESLQLFSSTTESQGVKVGLEVKAKVGVDVQGIGEAGEEVTVAEEVSVNAEYTTSQTAATEKTWSESKKTTTSVSRKRTLTLPPFTAVEAYDAVKTINDVRVPFTQTVRIEGTYRDNGDALSGAEIQSQMLFNLVGGVLHTVGPHFVDVSVRGEAVIDKLFEATSNVNELPDACN